MADSVELPRVAKAIFSFISIIDSYGAYRWNLRLVALVSALVLVPTYKLAGYKGGVEWHGLLHSLVVGLGGLACTYLDYFASEAVTGEPEPLHMAQCGPPMTSLHRILPAITLGYSVTDVYNGLALGKIDFVLHGVATTAVMLVFCELDVPHTIVQMLVMEVSTIFLCLRKIKLGEKVKGVMSIAFAVSFILCRNLITPYVWGRLVHALYYHGDANCFHKYYFPLVVAFGVFFHTLNLYWLSKIIVSVRRMASGGKKNKKD